MNKSLALKNKLYLFLLLILTLSIFAYLLYFLINGERGIISFFKIKNLNNDYKIVLSNLQNKNDFFVDRIKRLKSNSLDLDYLEESIIEKTGHLNEDEILIKFD